MNKPSCDFVCGFCGNSDQDKILILYDAEIKSRDALGFKCLDCLIVEWWE